MLSAGTSKADVARAFEYNRATLHALWNHYNQNDRTDHSPRPGALRATTPQKNRLIHLAHSRNCHLTADSTYWTLFRGRVCEKTIRNRVRSNNLQARKHYNRTILTRRHRNVRLRLAILFGFYRLKPSLFQLVLF